MTKIGKNIKKIRTVKGLSQQAFADLFNLTRGNISSYEEFRAEPRIDVIVKIANYFSIPVTDLIEKELSVNELLNFNTELVDESEKLKLSQQLVKIPYVPANYIENFISNHNNSNFLTQLPEIVIPSNSRHPLMALEINDQETLPAKFNYHNGDILIFEQVVKENVHRIFDRLGCRINGEGIKYGIYKQLGDTIVLSLNEYVEYTFDLHNTEQYYVLRSVLSQSV